MRREIRFVENYLEKTLMDATIKEKEEIYFNYRRYIGLLKSNGEYHNERLVRYIEHIRKNGIRR